MVSPSILAIRGGTMMEGLFIREHGIKGFKGYVAISEVGGRGWILKGLILINLNRVYCLRPTVYITQVFGPQQMRRGMVKH